MDTEGPRNHLHYWKQMDRLQKVNSLHGYGSFETHHKNADTSPPHPVTYSFVHNLLSDVALYSRL